MQTVPEQGRTFGQLLDWQLERGTRPDGLQAKKGVPWGNKDFANSVGDKSSEPAKGERTIRNWRNGATLPSPADFHAILLVLFGVNEDYAEWKAELTDKYHAARTQMSDGPALGPALPSLPAKPPRCIGRDEDLKSVVSALTAASSSASILILGGPGMGKTTLTREAASEPAVVSRFGDRRWFVELETATDAQTFRVAIVTALGLDPATAGFDVALDFLGRAPGLLVLDNLETPWDGARGEIEALLGHLHRVPSLAILASVRGNEPPGGLRWTRQKTMHPLEWPHDRELFLDIAQKIKPEDPALEPLLKELGGIPLAVELTAQEATAHDTLYAVLDEWRRIGSALAKRRGVEPSRLTSLDISLELSFNSRRLGAAGRRLFSILGQLPAGIGADDLNALLGNEAFEAWHGLLSCGLAFERGGRLDLLPPVRDHARRQHPPAEEDAALWRHHFLALARDHGSRIGKAEGAGSVQRLAAELPNLDAAQRAALSNEDLKAALSAVYGIAVTMRLTGLGSPLTIRELATACATNGNILGEATCIESLGDIALDRSDHEAARKAYEQALTLYGQVGDIPGEANCIKSLGDIALARSDHEAARKAYEQALPFYRQVGDILGEANCIERLGNIALERSDHEWARKAFEQALPLHRQVGNILGEANCIERLGNIVARSDHEAARKACEQALLLYQQVGAIFGEANCIKGLGDIAFKRSNYEAARKAFEQALPLYRQVGNILGEANCIQGLGDIALARSDHEAAHGSYLEALNLYERIPEPYSIGQTHRRLAATTDGEDRDRHLAAARAAWTSIDRADLVALLK
ncbi:MAG: tetratricopeptide repeat protein [Xanthobacteraceae bacterium]|jgi:tetratricopeptide (TPR) repeat protein